MFSIGDDSILVSDIQERYIELTDIIESDYEGEDVKAEARDELNSLDSLSELFEDYNCYCLIKESVLVDYVKNEIYYDEVEGLSNILSRNINWEDVADEYSNELDVYECQGYTYYLV